MAGTTNIELSSLGFGALQEKFEDALDKTIKNILDVNTPAEKARTITATITLKPLSKDRRQCKVLMNVSTKLPPREVSETIVYVGQDEETGETASSEYNPSQMGLFDAPPTPTSSTEPLVTTTDNGGKILNINMSGRRE